MRSGLSPLRRALAVRVAGVRENDARSQGVWIGKGTQTVTIQVDNNIEISDAFDFVKIENVNKIDSYELDDSVDDDGQLLY